MSQKEKEMQNVLNHLLPFAASVVSAIIAGTLLVVTSLASKHGFDLASGLNALVLIAAISYCGLIGLVTGLASDLVRLWVFSNNNAGWTYVASTVIAAVASIACLVSMGSLQTESNIPPIALVVVASTLSWSVAHYKTFASNK